MPKLVILCVVHLLAFACRASAQQAPPSQPKHFVFFAHERERIREPSFLAKTAIGFGDDGSRDQSQHGTEEPYYSTQVLPYLRALR